MINLIPTELKSKGKSMNSFNPISFRSDKFVRQYLKSICNTTLFINKALIFYIMLINQPEKVMIILKEQQQYK